MTTYLGKSCSFGLPRVPFVNCGQFMYLVISLLVLRAGCGIWLYQFLIIAYLFTFNISEDNYLDQLVLEPTRITEDTENILDLFFSNTQTLVNRVQVIPGISDQDFVYIESSLYPAKAITSPRKVNCYNKADFESLKRELKDAKEEFDTDIICWRAVD